MTRLFINYYNDNHPDRQEEINECISRNIVNSEIDQVFLIVERPDTLFYNFARDPKVEIILNPQRPFYSCIFMLANERITGDDITIIANADIYFEERDIMLARNYLGPQTCFALSRWEKGSGEEFYLFDRSDSQDSWLFKGPIKMVGNCEFSMGKPGCDNAIAQRIEAAGYSIHNPSHAIKSYHLHNSGIRNYNPGNSSEIVEQPYKLVPTSGLDNFPLCNWITEIDNLSPSQHYSQYGEDAIIDHIFKNIGLDSKYFVDLGAGAYGQSSMSNTRRLKQAGWTGFGVDANSKGEDWIIERFITPDNILQILAEQDTPKEFDFLNLDIDSCDFWVLKKVLEIYRPRCICTEYNGTLNPSVSIVLKYEEGYTWDETNRYGYSFAAGQKLLTEFGYCIIYNQMNQNLFALKHELVKGLIFEVTANRALYHPENQNAIWEIY